MRVVWNLRLNYALVLKHTFACQQCYRGRAVPAEPLELKKQLGPTKPFSRTARPITGS